MPAPPPIPPIADADRYISYAPVSSTSVFAVPFPVFGDWTDLGVYYNGVRTTNFSFSSASGTPISQIPLPITDGQVTLTTAISSGMLEIFGDWRARQGVLSTSSAISRYEYQQAIGQIVASLREAWSAIFSTFPLSKSGRANTYLAFDSSGNPYGATTVSTTSITVSTAMAPVIAATTYTAALGIMGFSSYVLTLIGAPNAAAFCASLGFSTFGLSLASAANAAAALTTLGVSTFMQTVLSAANAAAAQTALGLSAFGQTLATAANAAAALTSLGLSSLAQSVVAQPTAAAWQNLLGYSSFRRQTVIGGPVSPAWLPAFLPATAASLSMTSQLLTSSTPLVVTAANGGGLSGANDLVGLSSTNLTWPSLAPSTTNYLYVSVAANGALTPGSTVLPPINQWGAAPTTTAGQFTFNIGEMRGYMGNGTTAPQASLVFVGEAVTSATAVTSTVPYAYEGVFISPLMAMPATSTQIFVTHNLGYPPLAYDMGLGLVAVAANAGLYPIGAEIDAGGAWAGNGTMALSAIDQHVAALSTGNSMSLSLPPYAGGAPAAITPANWNLRLVVRRTF